LSKKDDLQESLAMAHAHAMRAEVLPAEQAVADAQHATQLDPTNDKAWRTLADAYEATGNVKGQSHVCYQGNEGHSTTKRKTIDDDSRHLLVYLQVSTEPPDEI
jgi:predicted Zn-dependent protease